MQLKRRLKVKFWRNGPTSMEIKYKPIELFLTFSSIVGAPKMLAKTSQDLGLSKKLKIFTCQSPMMLRKLEHFKKLTPHSNIHQLKATELVEHFLVMTFELFVTLLVKVLNYQLGPQRHVNL